MKKINWKYWLLMVSGLMVIIGVYVSTGGPFRTFDWWERVTLTGLTGIGLGAVLAWDEERRKVNRINDFNRITRHHLDQLEKHNGVEGEEKP